MERMEDGDNRMESIFGRVAELIPDQALLPVLLSSLGSRLAPMHGLFNDMLAFGKACIGVRISFTTSLAIRSVYQTTRLIPTIFKL
jgi:hypothetical protein